MTRVVERAQAVLLGASAAAGLLAAYAALVVAGPVLLVTGVCLASTLLSVTGVVILEYTKAVAAELKRAGAPLSPELRRHLFARLSFGCLAPPASLFLVCVAVFESRPFEPSPALALLAAAPLPPAALLQAAVLLCARRLWRSHLRWSREAADQRVGSCIPSFY